MAITIDGTDGISPLKASGQTQTTTGTAAAPAISSSSDTDSGIFFGTNEVKFSTGGTHRATLDSSGKLDVLSGDLRVTGGEGVSAALYLVADEGDDNGDSWRIISNQDDNDLTVSTNNSGSFADRGRFVKQGHFQASSSGNFYGTHATLPFHSFNQNMAGQWTVGVRNEDSNPYGLIVRYNTDTNTAGNECYYFIADGTARYYVRSNGGIVNYQSNDANLCDEREKKNIVNLDSKWDKVKSWELKKFHYNEDADTDNLRYGVIAQQVEEHCPEVLVDWEKRKAEDAVLDEDGNVVTPAQEQVIRKGVKEQQMMWMAIKALQEAQARIETLETQNADLLARVTALEAAE
jgi:hypothetical protein